MFSLPAEHRERAKVFPHKQGEKFSFDADKHFTNFTPPPAERGVKTINLTRCQLRAAEQEKFMKFL